VSDQPTATAAAAPLPVGERPLAALRLTPSGAFAYVVFIIVFNVGLAFAAASPAAVDVLRGLVIAVAGTGTPTRELLSAVVTGVLAVLSYVVIVAPVVVLAAVRGLRFGDAFGLRRFHPGQAARLAGGVALLGILVTLMWALVLRGFGLSAPSNTVRIVQGFGTSRLAIAIGYMLVGLVAPFGEEIAFRAVVFSSLRESWGMLAALLVSGALFGIVHLIPLEAVPLAVIGIALAGVFTRTRSLWPSILAHAVYNIVVLTIAFASAGLLR
jgi:membrane protease YdiL (CAAX protease family)